MLLALSLAACAAHKGTIGAVLGQKSDGRLFVREVEPGLAAERGGLASGDEILLIEGRDVRSMTGNEVHRVLSGEVGQAVKLTVVRGDEVLRITLRRTPARRRTSTPSKDSG
jgi:carboxyl-terminal processing protease